MSKWLISTLKASLVIVSIIILMLCIFWLPYMARSTVELFPEVSYLKYPILFGIYLTCIPFYIGIFQTFKLLRLIEKEDAFTDDASKSLRVITLSSICVIVLYIMGIVYLDIENALPPGLVLLGLTIIFAAFIIAVFSATLKALLIKVIKIKNENDLTI